MNFLDCVFWGAGTEEGEDPREDVHTGFGEGDADVESSQVGEKVDIERGAGGWLGQWNCGGEGERLLVMRVVGWWIGTYGVSVG